MRTASGHSVTLTSDGIAINGVEIGTRKVLSFFEQLSIQNYLVNVLDEIERILNPSAARPIPVERPTSVKKKKPALVDAQDMAEAEINKGKRVPDWLFAKNGKGNDDDESEPDSWI